MQKTIIRKLNSIGFIKSIEVELINGMETITLFFSKDDANKVNDIASTKDNFFHWLISDLHVKYSDLNDVEYVGNIIDESSDYIRVVMLLDMVKPASRENIIHTIANSMRFKTIPSLNKPDKKIVERVKIDSSLYFISLNLVVDELSYSANNISKGFDDFSDSPDLSLYTKENLIKFLKNITGSKIPEVHEVNSAIILDKLLISYYFYPGEHEYEIMEIFNKLTI